ncbi:protein E2 containing Ig domain [Equid gammaherpesvirus 5]|uniref:Protein E2 n=1 Tax=Equid gammaherpesvirus 5 TaxID=10371 RepID=A0A0B4Q699_9GAMA|nr:protein E2 [Equid gammaherpesvirus 5]AIU39529.1 protein E2 [Equid gammaherpesvirus 5]APT43412.1 protein E2 containing Ig domain [Equid gammaherpesvirus 5]
MIFMVVLASLMVKMALGSIQAWMPESYTGQEGKPLSIKCYFARADCTKEISMKLYKTIPLSVFLGTSRHPFNGPVFINKTCDSGTGVFSTDFLYPSDAGRYACVVTQDYDPKEEKACADYHTAFTKVIVTKDPPPQPTPPQFSVRAVKKKYTVYTDITLHVDCQFSGAIEGSKMSATLLKQNSEGKYEETTPATTTMTTLNLSPIIDGTGQAKWCSKGCTKLDTGNYKCEITMEPPEGDKVTVSDTFEVKVVGETGEDADEEDYVYDDEEKRKKRR